MLKNYFLPGWRNIRKQALFSVVNLTGLSLGFACCFLAGLYITDELSWDRFHEKAPGLYGITCRNEFHDETGLHVTMGTVPALAREFPEIETVVALNTQHQVACQAGDVIFNETTIFASHPFFSVFTFPMLAGNPETALQQADGVVLTRRMAVKYFQTPQVLGRTVRMNFGEEPRDYVITGICQDPPGHSTLQFDAVLGLTALQPLRPPEYWSNFNWFDTKVFVLLKPGMTAAAVNRRFPDFIGRYYRETVQKFKDSGSWTGTAPLLTFRLENIRDLHLNSRLQGIGAGSLRGVLIPGGIGLLILAVACINFINLSIGRTAYRSREMGVRKVLGAERNQFWWQFWGESLLLGGGALITGCLLAVPALSAFNSLAGKNLAVDSLFSPWILGALLLLLLLVALLAGSFPALVLARLNPAAMLKSGFRPGGRRILQRTLVAVQLSLGVILLVVTFTMASQFRHLNSAPLGFDQAGLIMVDLQENGFDRGPQTAALINSLRGRLASQPVFRSISGSTMGFDRFLVQNHIRINGKTNDVFYNRVADDYLKTMGVKLLAGRDFPADSGRAGSVLVNRAFVRQYGMGQPLGQIIYPAYEPENKLTIIGVVEDFHFQSQQSRIEPLILHMSPDITLKFALVKVQPDRLAEATGLLKNAWRSVRPGAPFLLSFMDEEVAGSYQPMQRWNRIVDWSAMLALLISGSGIMALTVISLSGRVREIGIRKVMGAGTAGLVLLINREFLLLAGLANLAAWPVAYYVAESWLDGYAYRISQGVPAYLGALGFCLLLTLTAVSALALRAASANPVQSIHQE